MTVSGYQYNLEGDLVPVPRQFYNDRFIPAPPLRIVDPKGEVLSTIAFLPWQDGGVVLLRGKLPLDGIMVFFGKEILQKGGVVRRPSDLQISYALPITRHNFNEMLDHFQSRSNLVVRPSEGKWIVQKFADEGSRSPYMARLMMGIMRTRDSVYTDPTTRDKFDGPFEQVISSLMSVRTATKEIVDMWDAHVRKIASGEIIRRGAQTIHIDENIDKELQRQLEGFLSSAVRAFKYGMQGTVAELQENIRFLFMKQRAFDSGIAKLQVTDPLLAEYLRQARVWSERLQQSRNDMEHNGWKLPRVIYSDTGSSITIAEPEISGQPVSQFVKFMHDRLSCFVEEVTVHCLQKLMPAEVTITEIPPAERLAELPERFRLTLGVGGLPRWNIAYHASSFEET